MDILTGDVPADAPAAAVLAAWQSLFFAVPVISTTFASFSRVFSQLGHESLGWLFIDEAGQSAPQAAAGAIWRCKRVVVVGDPKQIEPVVTLPFTAQQALRRNAGIAEWWLPGSTSTQRLADEANQYGTYLHGDDGEVWVGAPLRVHRRCERPMFDVSNAIAYGGMMVYGVSGQREPLAAPPSGWIDIPATGDAQGIGLQPRASRPGRCSGRCDPGMTSTRGRSSWFPRSATSPMESRNCSVNSPAFAAALCTPLRAWSPTWFCSSLAGTRPSRARSSRQLRASQSGQRRGQPRTPPYLRHRRPRSVVQAPLLQHLVQVLEAWI